MSEQVYARVENGKIVEYPVFAIHITNRAHPVEWYTPVIYTPRPETDEFHYLREVLTVSPDQKSVIVTYTIEPYDLDTLFMRIPLPSGVDTDPADPSTSNRPTDPPSEALIERIKVLVKERVQKRLDDFAATRGYSGMSSACSYAQSTVTKFKNEALRCIALRDATWVALYNYLDDINEGTEPLPYKYSIVEQKLPQLTWED